MPRKKRRVRITKRQKKMVKLIEKGASITDAGRAAQYNTRQAASNAYKRIKLRFHPALEAAGYDVDKECTAIYAKLKEKMECKETIWAQCNGIFLDSKEVIPHAEQRAAANDCARFLGVFGNGHEDTDHIPAGQVTVNVAIADRRGAELLMGIITKMSAPSERAVVDDPRDEDPR